MNIDDKFRASFERLLPEIYDVPVDNNGVPQGHITGPGYQLEVHPYAVMYRLAAERALEQSE